MNITTLNLNMVQLEPKSAVLGAVIGILIVGILWVVFSRRKRVDLSKLKDLVYDSMKKLHVVYGNLNSLYKIIQKAEKKGELVR